MDEMVEKIASAVQDNLILPGYSDKDMKDIIAFILTVSFTIMTETSADLTNLAKGKAKKGECLSPRR